MRKILVLGSGALKIGEAGEFDYSGSQAVKALKEEGIKTVLVNPNIATIQTSRFLADKIYFLPVKLAFVEKVIAKEKPDGILLSFGGQTALNCGIELHKKGVLKKHKVAILGTPMSAILLTEDRKRFAEHLQRIGMPIPKSTTAKSVKEAVSLGKTIGYPVIVRAGYALGGQGSGIARSEKELLSIATKAFLFSPQILIEQYLNHYKEVEYEVVRDSFDNCIAVCNMENMDPMGIHTGESIVVAPSQTLTNLEYHTLRTAAIQIVRSLGIVGECNVQFALNPNPKSKYRNSKQFQNLNYQSAKQKRFGNSNFGRSNLFRASDLEFRNSPFDFYVIEVNARLSRSSALASKATGYPLAYVAAKLALGKSLTKITNKVTGITQSCFEPALDYVVVKIPRWDMEKFRGAEEEIGSSMKSVGEVMGIGRTFEEAMQKAVRMLDLDLEGPTSLPKDPSAKNGQDGLTLPTPRRLFTVTKALATGASVKRISSVTGIDPWFLMRLKHIVDEEKSIKRLSLHTITKERLLQLKQLGFSDKRIGELFGVRGLVVRNLRRRWGIKPSVLQIDTLAAEFPAKTNYLYLTYNAEHHDIAPTGKRGVVVLGSGPYRIGSSVEFDWTSVATVLSLKEHKKESIIINCNPETVSTDYDVSNKLYFEELSFERIADILEFERPFGVVVSVGGQTPNNRSYALKRYGFKVLGTNPVDIDRAEQRSTFAKLLDRLAITQPPWNKFTSIKAAVLFSEKVGYPVLTRPSYVLSGTSMAVCHNQNELTLYLRRVAHISKEYPITVSKFIENAKELELDAVAQKGLVISSIISEHVEDAGVHSGDATIVLPAQQVNRETQRKIHAIAQKLARELRITGPFNIQFLAKENHVSVIEINLRSSRTFPFVSKVTGVDFIRLATSSFFAKAKRRRANSLRFVAVKVPQFSFARLLGADPILRVEMASTGEVACFGEDVEEAFLKGELAVGGAIPTKGIFVSLGGEENKVAFLESVKRFSKLSLPIFATEKTAAFLRSHGIKARRLYKIYERKSPNILECFQRRKVDLAINLVEHARLDQSDHYTIRRAAIDHNIPLYTNLKKAQLFARAIAAKKLKNLSVKSWDEYVS